MATSVWTGTISFGLVSIPVKLYTATTSHDVSFNLLHNECQGRINLQNYCPQCERVVERSELIKGYQYEKNQYAIINEEDLNMLITEVIADQIDHAREQCIEVQQLANGAADAG